MVHAFVVPATPTVTMTCFPSSASASSCSSSSTSHLASPPVCAINCCITSPVSLCLSHCIRVMRLCAVKKVNQVDTFLIFPQCFLSVSLQQSLAEGQHLRAKALVSPTQDATGFLLKDSSGGGSSSKNSSCDTDDFVMVPAHFTGKKTFFFHRIRSLNLEYSYV